MAGTAARGREQLTDDLLEALTAWNPTDRLSAFKTWQRRALSLIHLQVITILELQGPLAMNRLAELTGVSVASATGIVARMEGRHLVERRHDDSDRRLVLVALTSTGKRMFRVIEQRRRAHLRKILGQLSEDELGGVPDRTARRQGSRRRDERRGARRSAFWHGPDRSSGQGARMIGLLRTYLRPYAGRSCW